MNANRLLGFLALGLLALVSPVVLAAPVTSKSNPLIVHEWGTFSSLQDESGGTLSGVNSDDELLPEFVHDLNRELIIKPNHWRAGSLFVGKGGPERNFEITMRLETPVIYFYPPKNATLPMTVDVDVAWHGGWLTQFYPDAKWEAPGAFRHLTSETTGKLSWSQLKIGTSGLGPETSEHVWTAPRKVRAVPVTSQKGESEKYVFYRGAGHLKAPFQVTRTKDQLVFRSQLEPGSPTNLKVNEIWLAEFRSDGSAAFRALSACELTRSTTNQPLLSTSAAFDRKDFSASNLEKLRSIMHKALVKNGLYNDEAAALLSTWEFSYFKSAGQRLFFLVPREWTDHYLPLKISVPNETARIMVGRIELVTPTHRKLLAELAKAPVPTKPWATAENSRVFNEATPVAYRDLGRFRNALILDEFRRRPTPSLRAFIDLNRLHGFGLGEAAQLE